MATIFRRLWLRHHQLLSDVPRPSYIHTVALYLHTSPLLLILFSKAALNLLTS
jgi:hypothetical protein